MVKTPNLKLSGQKSELRQKPKAQKALCNKIIKEKFPVLLECPNTPLQGAFRTLNSHDQKRTFLYRVCVDTDTRVKMPEVQKKNIKSYETEVCCLTSPNRSPSKSERHALFCQFQNYNLCMLSQVVKQETASETLIIRSHCSEQ